MHPQPESYWGHVNPIGPRACYDEGKRVAETLAYAYHKQSGVEVRVARIFNTYGPRMHANDGRVVSNFVMQALQEEPITIYGSGEQTRCDGSVLPTLRMSTTFSFSTIRLGWLELSQRSLPGRSSTSPTW